MDTRAGAERARKLIKRYLLPAAVPLAAIWLYVVAQSMTQVSSLMDLARDIAQPARQGSPAPSASTRVEPKLAPAEPSRAQSSGPEAAPRASSAEPVPTATSTRRPEETAAPPPYVEPSVTDPYSDAPEEDDRLRGITDPRIRALVAPAAAD